MTDRTDTLDAATEAKTLNLLDEGRILSVATLRPDGWPQVTTVGYVHDGLIVHFAIDADSQKYRNIQRDARISMAIAFSPTGSRPARGLSVAALAERVLADEDVTRINDALARSYFGRASFAPHGPQAVIIRAMPTIISLVEDSPNAGALQTFRVPS